MASADYTNDKETTPPCGFCGLGTLPAPPPARPITHGICPTCRAHALGLDTRTVAVPGLPHKVLMVPVSSSNIARVGWRASAADVGTLLVEFKGGPLFRYANVAHAWFREFLAAESKGRFFAATVRADPERHPFARVEDARWPS